MQQRRRSFLATASGTLLVAACALGSCQQPSPVSNGVDVQPANGQEVISRQPDVPRPAARLDRAALLSAVAIAASAAASGADTREGQRHLDGSIFELSIRFGCTGPSKALRDEAFGWDLDQAKRRLRVRAMPTISMEDELVARFAVNNFEAVEGFWIPRPWMLDPVCPVSPTLNQSLRDVNEKTPVRVSREKTADKDQSGTAVTPQRIWPRIGIAQFFTSTESRTQRRLTRAYEASKTIEQGKPIGSDGFNLVLSGRLKALPGGNVIACSASLPDAPPDCVISADFDRVWIERPESEEVIAEWGRD